jgi:hypothetical protein
MAIRTPLICFLLIITAPIGPTAQQQGRISGNPTPGTPQPDPPKLADRITVVGCVQFGSPRGQGRGAVAAGELNSLSNSTFILTGAAREGRVPPGTGTSEVARTTKSPTYRLSAINSALVPFVGARVEISGEVQASASPEDNPQLPILQVGFVQRIARTCS